MSTLSLASKDSIPNISLLFENTLSHDQDLRTLAEKNLNGKHFSY